MLEKLKGVMVEMGARTAQEAAEDLEAIAAVLRSGEGVSALPNRLLLGPRMLTLNIQTDPTNPSIEKTEDEIADYKRGESR